MPAAIIMSAASAFSASTRMAPSGIRFRLAEPKARTARSARSSDLLSPRIRCRRWSNASCKSMCATASKMSVSSTPCVGSAWCRSGSMSIRPRSRNGSIAEKTLMREIIKHQAIVSDDWNVLRPEENQSPEEIVVPSGRQIVPLEVWLAQRKDLFARADICVWIASDERPEDLQHDAARLPVIAVDFLFFVVGCGFLFVFFLCVWLGFFVVLCVFGVVLCVL